MRLAVVAFLAAAAMFGAAIIIPILHGNSNHSNTLKEIHHIESLLSKDHKPICEIMQRLGIHNTTCAQLIKGAN